MATSTTRTKSVPSAWRSATAIPVRRVLDAQGTRDTATGRIPLVLPRPAVPGGGFRPKAFAGEIVPFIVTAFREGHDRIGVHLRLFAPSGDESLHRLLPAGDGFDRWSALVAPLEQGIWSFRFEGFADDFATWQHAADVKIEADVDVGLMRESGALLFDRASQQKDRPVAERRALQGAAAAFRDPQVSDEVALGIVRDPAIAAYFAARPLTSLATVGATHELLVERERAGVGAWYEFFPRSEGARRLKDGSIKSGTFRSAAKRIPD
ncbi:MAG TPA: maltotransferase domain-containing protein, partial [Microbacterium sp.]|uniref:maltotransferase domain-containing protein n=1 Tax=Microbacterium sp. TaxID=51671 RepID=UPI002BC81D04